MTTLKLLDEVYNVPLSDQVIKAACGMNGAGRYGGQCGLVEGMLMFLGIWSSLHGMSYSQIQDLCNSFAGKFEEIFGSLSCAKLRVEAEALARDPDQVCEELKIQAILMDLDFLDNIKAQIGTDGMRSKL